MHAAACCKQKTHTHDQAKDLLKGEREKAQTTICKLTHTYTHTQCVAHTQLTNEKQPKLYNRPLANH